MQIIKGGNLPLSGEPMRVAVVRRSGGPGQLEVDAAALLVDASGRVRGQHDLVFYNQPVHQGSGVKLLGNAQGEGGVVADWLEIDPGGVEASVERIVVAASCEGGTFADVSDLYMQAVSATTGAQLALYEVEDATTETAILLGEFYRRNGGWKFRAVGQGYASGLPGLAGDFGFTVAEEPAAAPGPAPTVPGHLPPAPPLPDTVTPPVPVPDAAVQPPYPAPQPPASAAPRTAPVPAPLPAPVLAPLPDGAAGTPYPAAQPAPVLAPLPDGAAQSPYPAPVPPATAAGAAVPRNGLPAEFGPDFPHFEQSGSGDEVVRVDVPITAGYVVVELVKEGDGATEIVTLDHRNQKDKEVLFSWIENLRARALVDHDGHGPLRLHVLTQDDWTLSVRPVSTLRTLSEGRIEGHGPDVVAHTGDAVDLAIRTRGDEDGDGFFEIEAVRPNGKRDDVFSRWDKGRGSAPLTAGPRLLVVTAPAAWSIEPREIGTGSFWRRRR
ncbi:TerD family protein [Streptomyces sp. NPDC005017]|uniref:TerD family protein n=1 Tax=Streptomyces sp. NPDC005017 TaxID=3364706 RepID=UPI003690B852